MRGVVFNVFIIVYLILNISCITDRNVRVIDYNFEIKNSSGQDIRILALKKNNVFSNHQTYIQNMQTIRKMFTSTERGRGFIFEDVLEGDSIKVIYNNSKFKIFYCFIGSGSGGCDMPRNILAEIQDYDSSENVISYKYEFTVQDYENAQPCNGNCD